MITRGHVCDGQEWNGHVCLLMKRRDGDNVSFSRTLHNHDQWMDATVCVGLCASACMRVASAQCAIVAIAYTEA
jgi:hypothetical protein